ncbi:MAG: hypothetical protein ACYS0E_01910 [Planctomycetota bacterium]|jgi:hypothetical protein
MRNLILALLVLSIPGYAQESQTKEDAKKKKTEKAKQALNKAFKGRVIRIKKKTVTIYYDFEDEEQLKDFEDIRPPRLLDLAEPKFFIQAGRLFLDGSTSVRHKMEGSGKLHAHFFLRPGMQKNVGTVFTEPVMSDFFTVLNLFDRRFYEDGALIMAACGLHEDEGADKDMAMVNWRDLVRGDVRKAAKVGQDVEVEVFKDGWTEYCRVGKFEGKGSSKGKGKKMKAYQFGLWCDHSRMSIDDLSITLTLTDEFLNLNDLKAEIDVVWEEVPDVGAFKGVKGVPPRLRRQVDDYVARKTREAKPILEAMDRTGLSKKVREIACNAICERGDPRVVPDAINGLYSDDKMTRKLTIKVIKSLTGKSWGLTPAASERKRKECLGKLNQHLAENKRKYYG